MTMQLINDLPFMMALFVSAIVGFAATKWFNRVLSQRLVVAAKIAEKTLIDGDEPSVVAEMATPVSGNLPVGPRMRTKRDRSKNTVKTAGGTTDAKPEKEAQEAATLSTEGVVGEAACTRVVGLCPPATKDDEEDEEGMVLANDRFAKIVKKKAERKARKAQQAPQEQEQEQPQAEDAILEEEDEEETTRADDRIAKIMKRKAERKARKLQQASQEQDETSCDCLLVQLPVVVAPLATNVLEEPSRMVSVCEPLPTRALEDCAELARQPANLKEHSGRDYVIPSLTDACAKSSPASQDVLENNVERHDPLDQIAQVTDELEYSEKVAILDPQSVVQGEDEKENATEQSTTEDQEKTDDDIDNDEVEERLAVEDQLAYESGEDEDEDEFRAYLAQLRDVSDTEEYSGEGKDEAAQEEVDEEEKGAALEQAWWKLQRAQATEETVPKWKQTVPKWNRGVKWSNQHPAQDGWMKSFEEAWNDPAVFSGKVDYSNALSGDMMECGQELFDGGHFPCADPLTMGVEEQLFTDGCHLYEPSGLCVDGQQLFHASDGQMYMLACVEVGEPVFDAAGFPVDATGVNSPSQGDTKRRYSTASTTCDSSPTSFLVCGGDSYEDDW